MEFTRFSEAPDQFHKWTAVSTIAGALRKRVWFDMGYFKWTPNFFIFFVGPSGVATKSTSMNIGFDLLKEIPGINFGPSVASWQALVQAIGACNEEIITPTGEFVPMSAMNIALSELGTLIDPKNKDMVDVLVDLWDGKDDVWTKITKKDGEEFIVNPWVNMIGCTTPSWIAENVSDYFIGGGFSSRAVFIYAEQKRMRVAYPKELMKEYGDGLGKLKAELIKDLEAISESYGEYELSREAAEWGKAWYNGQDDSEEVMKNNKFIGHYSRRQAHSHKLAMVLAASRRNELVITKEDLIDATKELEVVEKDMQQVFGFMNREVEMVIAADVLDVVRKEKRIQKTALYRKFMRSISSGTFNKILDSLISSAVVKQVSINGLMLIEAIYDQK